MKHSSAEWSKFHRHHLLNIFNYYTTSEVFALVDDSKTPALHVEHVHYVNNVASAHEDIYP